jgi:hypothetical protein
LRLPLEFVTIFVIFMQIFSSDVPENTYRLISGLAIPNRINYGAGFGTAENGGVGEGGEDWLNPRLRN